ncbi:sugar phosphate isomerase/epimerase family protein [Mesorhizobium sp. IMUNJ 23033]|uniref:sugar phosphate isomerase/epimerase family protein n=1 Tax=Mesorhizobium sp. IMUNJ 23033 TaxID=3378039 RepID=UPI00385140D7
MKIGMCMFLWTTSVSKKHEKLLRDIKATGFDGVEIPVFSGTPDDHKRLGDLLDRIGLERTAVSAMGDPSTNLISPDAATRKAGIDYMKWAIDCSEALGADRLSGPLHSTLGAFSGSGPTAAEKKRSVASQRAIGDHAGKRGVTIGLEALNRFECYLLNTMDDLCEHIDSIDRPHIKAMYDTFHANIEEADPIGAYTRNRKNIVHIHVSENDRGVPGRGNIPWAETFSAIRNSGYDDWLTIEAFGRSLKDLAAATKVWRDFSESPEAVYRDGYRHIKNGWKKAGAGDAAKPFPSQAI